MLCTECKRKCRMLRRVRPESSQDLNKLGWSAAMCKDKAGSRLDTWLVTTDWLGLVRWAVFQTVRCGKRNKKSFPPPEHLKQCLIMFVHCQPSWSDHLGPLHLLIVSAFGVKLQVPDTGSKQAAVSEAMHERVLTKNCDPSVALNN